MNAALTTSARDQKRVGNWVWLFPATYLAHMAEEYWGGFPAWLSGLGGAHYTPAHFLKLNTEAWLMMIVGTVLALKLSTMRWLIISYGAVVLLNGLAHFVATLVTGTYSPGLISGLVLWVPLGAYTLSRSWGRERPRTFWIAASAGFAMHGVVTLLALGAGRIWGA